jgi:UDP-glucose 4-epimerase
VVREIPSFFPGTQVVMVDNMSTQRYCSLFNLPAEGKYCFIEDDVLEIDLDEVVKGSDVVLHLAAMTDAANSFRNKEQMENINYNATVKVAEACRNNNCPMIHISSTSVYGTQLDVVDEDCSSEQLQPQSPYAEAKLKEEGFLKALGVSGDLRFVICRFGTICGVSPGMRFHTAVNKFCWQAVMGQPLLVWRTALHQKRPYLTLSDAMKAIIFIINNDIFDQRIYNILTANMTVNSIIQIIKQHVKKIDIKYVDTEIMNQLSYDVSNLRFRGQGFEFTGSLEKEILETVELLKNSWNTLHEL